MNWRLCGSWWLIISGVRRVRDDSRVSSLSDWMTPLIRTYAIEVLVGTITNLFFRFERENLESSTVLYLEIGIQVIQGLNKTHWKVFIVASINLPDLASVLQLL